MPSSVDGKYVEHKDDAQSETESDKDTRSRKSSVKSDHDRDQSDHNDGGPTLSKKFHIITLILLITTFICLMAIVPSRSLGVSGKLVCHVKQSFLNCYQLSFIIN